MVKVFNPTDYLVTLEIECGNVKDGIHVQPGGRVKLPSGFTLSARSKAENPRVEETSDEVTPAPTTNKQKGG